MFFTENTSPSNTPHTSANIVMTPQGQLLTLKGPLFSGPVVTVSPALLETDLKPQVASSAVAQSGIVLSVVFNGWCKSCLWYLKVMEKAFEYIL